MLERIAGIIREQLNLDNVEITEETSFKDDLDADSLDLFELVWHLKKLTMLRSLLKTLRSWKPSAMLWITSETKKSTLNLR